MSTRGCILALSGTDESEGRYEFDLHEDYQRPDELDVSASTAALNGFAEFSISREQVHNLYNTLGKWLERTEDAYQPNKA